MPTKNQYGGGLKFSSQETCGSRQRLSSARTSYYILHLKNKDFSKAYEILDKPFILNAGVCPLGTLKS